MAVGAALRDTERAEDTVRRKERFATALPAVPDTVSAYPPAGETGVALVPAVVVTVMVLVQEVVPGLQEAGLKAALAPEGRPDAESATTWLVPPVAATVMRAVPLPPCIVEISRSLSRVKVKGGVVVMTRSKEVVCAPGPLSWTVILEVPALAVEATPKERVTSQEEPAVTGGVQEAGVKEAATPEGRPVTLEGMKETAVGVPERVVITRVWVPVVPRRTETVPALVRSYPNPAPTSTGESVRSSLAAAPRCTNTLGVKEPWVE